LLTVPPGFYDFGGPCNFATDVNCQNEFVVPGINFNGSFTAAIPYSSGHGSFGYRWAPHTYAELAGTYYGNGNSYFRPAFTVWNVYVGHSITKNTSLLLTGRNIFNVWGDAIESATFANFTRGSPTVAGKPFVEIGQPYGPRALIFTLNAQL
jgi:hypothetical protein